MGKFQVGQAKPENSGRRKGVPNLKTLFLKDSLELLGLDLPTKIVELLPKLSPDKQMDAYLDLLQYVYPRRKGVELSGQNGQPIEVITQNENFKRVLADSDALDAFEKLERKLNEHSTPYSK
jgi:hypothetical protein